MNCRRILHFSMFVSFFIFSLSLKATQTPSDKGIFVPNAGQWPKEVKFMAKTPTMNLWITNKGIIHDVYSIQKTKAKKSSFMKHGHAIKMNFLGGIISSVKGMNASGTIMNYFKGKNPDSWFTGINSYESVSLDNVYDGIDIVYSFDNSAPRYDFHIKPGIDPDKISIAFEGAHSTSIQNGSVELKTRFGSLKNGQLYAFQVDEYGTKHQVQCSFKQENNALRFTVGNYDTKRTLVIDPLVYSTYITGSGTDVINKLVMDLSGNIVAGGYSDSPDLPTVTGSYDAVYNGSLDGIVIRFTPQLSKAISYTYIGGGGDDAVNSIAVSASGNIFLGGETSSANFPISTAWKDTYAGGIDGFVAKLSSDCTQLKYSTFLNGSGDDKVLAIAPRDNESVLVGGMTNSQNFPTDNGAFQRLKKSLNDGFMLELKPTASSGVNFSTFIGGDGEDKITGVGYDPAYLSVFFAGTTASGLSATYPVPTTGFGGDPSRKPWNNIFRGKDDGFVGKFNIAGTPSQTNGHYLGYLSSNLNDRVNALIPLDDGTVVVAGETEFGSGTTTFPTTGSTTSGKGGFDIFITRISVNGRSIQNSGVFGTSGKESANDIKFIKETTQILVAGYTNSRDFSNTQSGSAVTDGDYGGGTKDAIVMKVSNDLSDVSFSSLYGGAGEDEAMGVTDTPRGDIFIGGYTTSEDLKVFQESLEKTGSANKNGFIGKIAFGTIAMTSPSSYGVFCQGTNVSFNWTKEGVTATELVAIQISSDKGVTWNTIANNVQGASYNWKVPDTIKAGTVYRARVLNIASGLRDESDTTFLIGLGTVITQQPQGDSLCVGSRFRMVVQGNGKGTYEWKFNGNIIQGARDSVYVIASVKESDKGDYTAVVNTGCAATTSQLAPLIIKPTTKVLNPPQNTTVTAGNPIILSVNCKGLKLTYEWQVDGFKISNAIDSVYTIPTSNTGNAGKYRVIVRGECGVDTSALAEVIVNPASSVHDFTQDSHSNGIALQVLNNTNDDNMYCTVETNIHGNASISLVSNMGETVATLYKGMSIINESRQFPLPNGLPSGIYWIIAKIGNQTSSKQIAIIH